MDVGVVEAGDHRGAARIDDLRLRAAQPQHVAVAADADDLVATHRDRFRQGSVLVGGEHGSVVDDQIDRTVAVVSLGADHQAGDERDGNDPDDNERG